MSGEEYKKRDECMSRATPFLCAGIYLVGIFFIQWGVLRPETHIVHKVLGWIILGGMYATVLGVCIMGCVTMGNSRIPSSNYGPFRKDVNYKPRQSRFTVSHSTGVHSMLLHSPSPFPYNVSPHK